MAQDNTTIDLTGKKMPLPGQPVYGPIIKAPVKDTASPLSINSGTSFDQIRKFFPTLTDTQIQGIMKGVGGTQMGGGGTSGGGTGSGISGSPTLGQGKYTTAALQALGALSPDQQAVFDAEKAAQGQQFQAQTNYELSSFNTSSKLVADAQNGANSSLNAMATGIGANAKNSSWFNTYRAAINQKYAASQAQIQAQHDLAMAALSAGNTKASADIQANIQSQIQNNVSNLQASMQADMAMKQSQITSFANYWKTIDMPDPKSMTTQQQMDWSMQQEQTFGIPADMALQALQSGTIPADKLALQSTIATDRLAMAQEKLNEANALGSDYAPHVRTMNNDTNTKYVDASGITGTDREKIIQAAFKDGVTAITDPNNAADLVNIKDANSLLKNMQDQLSGVVSPDWMTRDLGGFAGKAASKFLQTSSTVGATGVFDDYSAEIQKALSGLRGQRGGQAQIALVLKNMPKVSDDLPTLQQKFKNMQFALNSRTNAILGDESGASIDSGTVDTGGGESGTGGFNWNNFTWTVGQ